MRLVRYYPNAAGRDRPRLGAWLGDGIVDLTEAFRVAGLALPPSGDQALDWLNNEAPWLGQAQALVAEVEGDVRARGRLESRGALLASEGVALASPVGRPGKIVCVGLNYRDHAAETGKPLPDRPMLFSKFTTAVIGPEEPIVLPSSSAQVDFEAELAVVIGRRTKAVARARALEAVLGYANINDVSARDFQYGDGQWQRGKSCDTFAPLGPYLVTADEVPDPGALAVRLRLNGAVMQDSNTRNLVFGVAELIAFISQTITLEPGDVIATGTPAGVGVARKPPVFLKAGDRVEVEVEGLGVLSNPVIREA